MLIYNQQLYGGRDELSESSIPKVVIETTHSLGSSLTKKSVEMKQDSLF